MLNRFTVVENCERFLPHRTFYRLIRRCE